MNAKPKLTDAERAVYDMIKVEGILCGHQLSAAERTIAARLERWGLISSERGCDRKHYF